MSYSERPKLKFFPCMIAAASVAATAASAGIPPADDAVRVVLEQRAEGPWRVTIGLPAAVPAIDLGRSLEGYRQRHWRAGAKLRLVERGGRDVIEAADGTPLRLVQVDVEPAPVEILKEYAPFTPMGDGGVLLYTGHFIPYASPDGPRMRAVFTVLTEGDAAVSAFGETAPRFVNWKSPFDRPAFIYVGKTEATPAGSLLATIDRSAPPWIREEILAFAPAIGAAFDRLLGAPPRARPDIFVAMGDLSHDGRLSYKGDALPGQYQMTLAGGVWKSRSDQALAVLRRTTAHEAAHLWQTAAPAQSNAVADWIHEGGADALAAEALIAAGYWSKDDAAKDFEAARAECAARLRGRSLAKAEAERDWKAVYACGYVIAVGAAGEGTVAAFWRELVVRAGKAGGYDEAMVLTLAEERAGARVAAAIRDLIRINNADPGPVLTRILGMRSAAP